LKAEKAFWANPNNYKHFSRSYWEKELQRDGLDFSFFHDKLVCEIGCGPFGMIYFTNAKSKRGVDPLIPYYWELGLLSNDKVADMALIPHGAESLPQVQDDSVDIVTCYNVLDHVQKPKEVLLETSRILKNGGLFYLNCHVVGNLLIPVRRMLKFRDPPHPHHFSIKDLRFLLSKTRFDVLREKVYRMTPSLTSLKALAGRLAMFHYSVLAKATKGSLSPWFFVRKPIIKISQLFMRPEGIE